MSSSYLALAIVYWLHMLATVVWIGALAAISLLVLPAARRTLSTDQLSPFLMALQKRLSPLAWFSLAMLVGTGMFQMSANPNYQGLMTINNSWAVAILVKHILFLAMIGLAAYQTWWLMPALQRSLIARRSQNASDSQTARLQTRETRVVGINLALGVLVLLLTAFARAF
jgi:uncharacterized membrane protein